MLNPNFQQTFNTESRKWKCTNDFKSINQSEFNSSHNVNFITKNDGYEEGVGDSRYNNEKSSMQVSGAASSGSVKKYETKNVKANNQEVQFLEDTIIELFESRNGIKGTLMIENDVTEVVSDVIMFVKKKHQLKFQDRTGSYILLKPETKATFSTSSGLLIPIGHHQRFFQQPVYLQENGSIVLHQCSVSLSFSSSSQPSASQANKTLSFPRHTRVYHRDKITAIINSYGQTTLIEAECQQVIPLGDSTILKTPQGLRLTIDGNGRVVGHTVVETQEGILRLIGTMLPSPRDTIIEDLQDKKELSSDTENKLPQDNADSVLLNDDKEASMLFSQRTAYDVTVRLTNHGKQTNLQIFMVEISESGTACMIDYEGKQVFVGQHAMCLTQNGIYFCINSQQKLCGSYIVETSQIDKNEYHGLQKNSLTKHISTFNDQNTVEEQTPSIFFVSSITVLAICRHQEEQTLVATLPTECQSAILNCEMSQIFFLKQQVNLQIAEAIVPEDWTVDCFLVIGADGFRLIVGPDGMLVGQAWFCDTKGKLRRIGTRSISKMLHVGSMISGLSATFFPSNISVNCVFAIFATFPASSPIKTTNDLKEGVHSKNYSTDLVEEETYQEHQQSFCYLIDHNGQVLLAPSSTQVSTIVPFETIYVRVQCAAGLCVVLDKFGCVSGRGLVRASWFASGTPWSPKCLKDCRITSMKMDGMIETIERASLIVHHQDKFHTRFFVLCENESLNSKDSNKETKTFSLCDCVIAIVCTKDYATLILTSDGGLLTPLIVPGADEGSFTVWIPPSLNQVVYSEKNGKFAVMPTLMSVPLSKKAKIVNTNNIFPEKYYFQHLACVIDTQTGEATLFDLNTGSLIENLPFDLYLTTLRGGNVGFTINAPNETNNRFQISGASTLSTAASGKIAILSEVKAKILTKDYHWLSFPQTLTAVFGEVGVVSLLDITSGNNVSIGHGACLETKEGTRVWITADRMIYGTVLAFTEALNGLVGLGKQLLLLPENVDDTQDLTDNNLEQPLLSWRQNSTHKLSLFNNDQDTVSLQNNSESLDHFICHSTVNSSLGSSKNSKSSYCVKSRSENRSNEDKHNAVTPSITQLNKFMHADAQMYTPSIENLDQKVFIKSEQTEQRLKMGFTPLKEPSKELANLSLQKEKANDILIDLCEEDVIFTDINSNTENEVSESTKRLASAVYNNVYVGPSSNCEYVHNDHSTNYCPVKDSLRASMDSNLIFEKEKTFSTLEDPVCLIFEDDTKTRNDHGIEKKNCISTNENDNSQKHNTLKIENGKEKKFIIKEKPLENNPEKEQMVNSEIAALSTVVSEMRCQKAQILTSGMTVVTSENKVSTYYGCTVLLSENGKVLIFDMVGNSIGLNKLVITTFYDGTTIALKPHEHSLTGAHIRVTPREGAAVLKGCQLFSASRVPRLCSTIRVLPNGDIQVPKSQDAGFGVKTATVAAIACDGTTITIDRKHQRMVGRALIADSENRVFVMGAERACYTSLFGDNFELALLESVVARCSDLTVKETGPGLSTPCLGTQKTSASTPNAFSDKKVKQNEETTKDEKELEDQGVQQRLVLGGSATILSATGFVYLREPNSVKSKAAGHCHLVTPDGTSLTTDKITGKLTSGGSEAQWILRNTFGGGVFYLEEATLYICDHYQKVQTQKVKHVIIDELGSVRFHRHEKHFEEISQNNKKQQTIGQENLNFPCVLQSSDGTMIRVGYDGYVVGRTLVLDTFDNSMRCVGPFQLLASSIWGRGDRCSTLHGCTVLLPNQFTLHGASVSISVTGHVVIFAVGKSVPCIAEAKPNTFIVAADGTRACVGANGLLSGIKAFQCVNLKNELEAKDDEFFESNAIVYVKCSKIYLLSHNPTSNSFEKVSEKHETKEYDGTSLIPPDIQNPTATSETVLGGGATILCDKGYVLLFDSEGKKISLQERAAVIESTDGTKIICSAMSTIVGQLFVMVQDPNSKTERIMYLFNPKIVSVAMAFPNGKVKTFIGPSLALVTTQKETKENFEMQTASFETPLTLSDSEKMTIPKIVGLTLKDGSRYLFGSDGRLRAKTLRGIPFMKDPPSIAKLSSDYKQKHVELVSSTPCFSNKIIETGKMHEKELSNCKITTDNPTAHVITSDSENSFNKSIKHKISTTSSVAIASADTEDFFQQKALPISSVEVYAMQHDTVSNDANDKFQNFSQNQLKASLMKETHVALKSVEQKNIPLCSTFYDTHHSNVSAKDVLAFDQREASFICSKQKPVFSNSKRSICASRHISRTRHMSAEPQNTSNLVSNNSLFRSQQLQPSFQSNYKTPIFSRVIERRSPVMITSVPMSHSLQRNTSLPFSQTISKYAPSNLTGMHIYEKSSTPLVRNTTEQRKHAILCRDSDRFRRYYSYKKQN